MKINSIARISIILSFVAGYADTSSFVGADELFSAQVTGNFVVFAYDIVTDQISLSWSKLISVPVFILSIIFSTLLINDADISKKNTNRLLILEGLLLITAGGMTYFYRYENIASVLKVIIPMLVVFALGLQNAYGRFSVKEILAPTTVMTGNVTQLFIDITHHLKFRKHQEYELSMKIVNGSYVILFFLVGCISGGLITKSIGLSSTVFAGILVFIASSIKKGSVVKS
jgi:uncharacterized membrane protein YoaK (UPF0700 family)